MERDLQFDKEKMRNLLSERVNQYAYGISEYTAPIYNETEVRVDFVNPLFKALG